jgi:hypothetical protein
MLQRSLTVASYCVRRASTALAGAAAAFLAGGALPAAADTLTTYQALLNGAQESPPVASPSQGSALLTLNKQSKMLCYSISFTPLGGTELVAHFHGPAQPGPCGTSEACTAGVLFDITGGSGPSPVGSPKVGCVGPLTKTDSKNLNKGLLYINIHSSIAPGGEIRGQVVPVQGLTYKKAVAISGALQPPGSASAAFLDDGVALVD